MSSVDELRKQIIELKPDEAEELAHWLWTFMRSGLIGRGTTVAVAGIDKTPDICGGDARIVRTRIPVWTLEQFRRQGLSEVEILQSFPTLRADDLGHAWEYVALFPDEIAQEIRENEEP